MGGHDGRRGFIHHTTVNHKYRGLGIGEKLVASVIKALEAEDIHKVALVAFEKNVSGNAFWEKVGFTVRNDLDMEVTLLSYGKSRSTLETGHYINIL